MLLFSLLTYHYIQILMTAQELPFLKNLQDQVENEARRTSEKFRPKDQVKQNGELPNAEPPKEKQTVQPKLDIKEEELMVKTNIFGKLPQRNNKINIFANSKSVNLFNLTSQQSNTKLDIFKNAFSSQPSVEDDQSSLSSQAEEEGHQSIKQPAEFVMQYTYEQRLQKVGQFKIVKFRPSNKGLIEGVALSVEKDSTAQDILYFVVRSEVTKLVVYKAIIMPNTKPETFMNKKENLKLTVMRIKEDNTSGQKQKNERDIVKLQFKDEEQAKRFEEVLVKKTN